MCGITERACQICRRYVVLFLCLVILTEQNEETMIFSKCVVLRARQQVVTDHLVYNKAYSVFGKNSQS